MISQRDMLGIILTESIESYQESKVYDKEDNDDLPPVLDYNLRIIKHPDGRLEWQD